MEIRLANSKFDIKDFKNLYKNLSKELIAKPVFNRDVLLVALTKSIHKKNIESIKVSVLTNTNSA